MSYFPDEESEEFYQSCIDKGDDIDETNRYESISERKDESLLPESITNGIQHNKVYFSKWKNTMFMKDPFDESLTRQLIYELHPKTIFEFGTFSGASADYMGMILNEYGYNDCKIFTYDLYPELRDKSLSDEKNNPKNIEFIKCDLSDISKIEALKDIKTDMNKYPHPWLIIEDCHACDFQHLFEFFEANGITKGDYIIVEDTIINKQKMSDLRQWLTENQHKGYMIDSKYCDLWGYNLTWNVNGWIKKVN